MFDNEENENQDLDSLVAEIKADPEETVIVEEKAPEPEARTPIYDTREYDAEGKQIGGSVYYTTEDMVKSIEEKDRYNTRLQNWSTRVNTEKEQLARRIQELETQGATRSAATKIATTEQKSLEGAEQFKLSEDERAALGDDLSNSLEAKFNALFTQVQEARQEPQRYFKQVTAEMEQRQERDRSLNEIKQLIAKHPNLYPDFDVAIEAEKDPMHPDHERAVKLGEVFELSRSVGSVEKAHNFLAFSSQQTDFEKQLKAAADKAFKEGQLAEQKRLKDGGARFVPVGGNNGARGVPNAAELAKMSPDERLRYQMERTKGIDLSEFSS